MRLLPISSFLQAASEAVDTSRAMSVVKALLFLLGLTMAEGLKCSSYRCASGSPCNNATETTCNTGMGEDRCVSYKFIERGLVQEFRGCFRAYQCAPHVFCDGRNSSGTVTECMMGCCDTDRCNTGPYPELPFRPTGPTGSDLSCYSCPRGSKCDNVTVQRCGVDPLVSVTQDRCLSMSIKRLVNGTEESLGWKTCGVSTYCGQTGCDAIKTLISGVTDCTSYCCFGNLCNAGWGLLTTAASTLKVNPNRSSTVGVFTPLFLALVIIPNLLSS
ncbi:uncharacterized protein LOC5512281 isoform X1 [Nematostella vectensis]|uniref:uncharacterized protein LOC5512281 isoform X1 n=1 Tax=Nematostella vectensis TaxID=45351 RepID=UPI002077395A|nr:uncharacterized protein LOC5512281 isoform X1 [Nematostella vectensis]